MKKGDGVRVILRGAGTEDAVGTIVFGPAPGGRYLVAIPGCKREWYYERELEKA